MPVPVLQQLIDSAHYSELLAFDQVRRPDSVNIQLLLIQLSYLVVKMNSVKGTDVSLDDFAKIIQPPKPKDQKSKRKHDDRMFDMMKVLTIALGGKVDTDGGTNGSKSERESNG